MSATVVRCGRCRRRMRRPDGWNATVRAGLVVAHLCPTCQTPAENTEAEINEALLIYGRAADGRHLARPRL